MKDILNGLKAAQRSMEVLNVEYKAKSGKLTTRNVIVEEVREEKDIVVLTTDTGTRTFKISGIQTIG